MAIIVEPKNIHVLNEDGRGKGEGIKIVLPDGRVVSAKLRWRDSGTDSRSSKRMAWFFRNSNYRMRKH